MRFGGPGPWGVSRRGGGQVWDAGLQRPQCPGVAVDRGPWGRLRWGLGRAAGGGGGVGLGWVGLGQGLIRTSGTTDIALPCASQLVRRVLGCPVSRPTGLMTAPVPRGGTRGREMPPCLCVWGVCWWGHEARRVTRQRRAWPGPGPVRPAGGGRGGGGVGTRVAKGGPRTPRGGGRSRA